MRTTVKLVPMALFLALLVATSSFSQQDRSIGWSSFTSERQYPGYKWMELNRSARFLVESILQIEPGENIVLYADTAADPRVVQATSAAIYTLGAHPITVWYETRGDIDLPPPAPVEAAVLSADMAIEFAVAYLVHSEMWDKARKKGIPMKCLTGMNVDMMIRTINPDSYDKMQEFGRAYSEVLGKARKEYRITNPAGTDLTFKAYTEEQRAARAARSRQRADAQGRRRGGMLGGQGGFAGDRSTATGTLVVDGAMWPPSEVAALEKPIEMKVKDGRVVEIVSDHEEARIMKNWFAHFNDPLAYEFVHISTGYHPGVKRITGDILEDERVFGAVEIGIGMASPDLPGHTDGVILKPSIWVDGVLIEDEGVFVEPTLKKLAEGLGMQLWVDSPPPTSDGS
jgi:leucyl aminopeptidase (aminopeptidase T)